LYSRTLIVLHGKWQNVQIGKFVTAGPKSDPLVTLMVDLSQGFWIARTNWQLTRSSFLHAVTGTAKVEVDDLLLYHNSDLSPARLTEYFMNGAPRREGVAVRGTHPKNADAYAQRTQWWRYDDPSIMSPVDRMAEMIDRAGRSPTLRSALSAQFGSLASPEVLLPIAGTFLAMFGAEFIGGAAAVLVVTRLMGINQLLCDYYFYEPRGAALHRIVMSAATPSDLDYGAKLIEEILVQLFSDIATAVGVHAIASVAKRLFSMLLHMTPESLRQKLLANRLVAAAYIRDRGYMRRDLLKDPAGTPLEHAAVEMYKKTSAERCEVLVVREPDARRATWVNSQVWNRGKPPWLKASSGDGWHGLVCLSEKELGGGHLEPAGTYDMGNLRGASAEIDHAIASNPRPKKFKMPADGRPINGPDGSHKIDYHYTGHNNVDLHGHYLVEVTPGKFMVVDSMGVPYASDLDLATRQRPGMKQAGDHIPASDRYHSKTKIGGAEDDLLLEYEMNRRYHETGGASVMHNPTLHGGGGATVAYTRNNLAAGKIPGKDFWTPKRGEGYKEERLVIFVPENVNGRIRSNMYILESWGAFKDFAHANGLEFPF
jgi:hypothetical protein